MSQNLQDASHYFRIKTMLTLQSKDLFLIINLNIIIIIIIKYSLMACIQQRIPWSEEHKGAGDSVVIWFHAHPSVAFYEKDTANNGDYPQPHKHM